MFVDVPGVENRVPIAIGDMPEQTEVEPNDTPDQAQLITPPCVINGRIDVVGDQDCFRFVARKGERFEFRIQSASLGFPLEATLKIFDAAGQQPTRQDDNGNPDPKQTWTAPTNGSYVAVVGDLFHRGVMILFTVC